MEREKEQTDHALMLRELQKLLAEERTVKEQLELQVFDNFCVWGVCGRGCLLRSTQMLLSSWTQIHNLQREVRK
jgi:hypothetical protein